MLLRRAPLLFVVASLCMAGCAPAPDPQERRTRGPADPADDTDASDDTDVPDDTDIPDDTGEPDDTDEPDDEPLVAAIDHSFLISYLGGVDVDPHGFEPTAEGFQDYLDQVGVVFFSAREYVTPHNPAVAARCGFDELLPERGWWRRGAVLGLMADELRDLVDEPVYLRNWWRPDCYNEGVGGAAGGDHPDADAVDLDFRSSRSRADAQRYLCELYWSQDLLEDHEIEPDVDARLNLSVGLGGQTIHLGVLSQRGRRYWKYGSYTAVSGSGSCW